jgi:hypothetical protein
MSTKRTCDLCDDEMEENYDPKFVFSHGTRKVRVIVSLVDDEENSGEDICHDCAKEAVQNIGFLEEDD